MLQPRYRPVHGILHILRQRAGHTAQIHLIGVKSLRLNKYLMTCLIWEFHYLILDGRAIARPSSFDRTGEQRRSVKIITNDLMCLLIGVGQPAGNLFLLYGLWICREGKRDNPLVTKLLFHLGKIDAAAVCTGRGSGLKTEHLDAVSDQGIRQMVRRLQAIRPCCIADIAINAACLQISSGGQYYSLCVVNRSGIGLHTGNLVILHNNFRYLCLTDGQMVRVFHGMTHLSAIILLVCLRTQGMDCRSLRLI